GYVGRRTEPREEQHREEEIGGAHERRSPGYEPARPESHEQGEERGLPPGGDGDEETVGASRDTGEEVPEAEDEHEHGREREVERVSASREAGDGAEGIRAGKEQRRREDVHRGGSERGRSHQGPTRGDEDAFLPI